MFDVFVVLEQFAISVLLVYARWLLIDLLLRN